MAVNLSLANVLFSYLTMQILLSCELCLFLESLRKFELKDIRRFFPGPPDGYDVVIVTARRQMSLTTSISKGFFVRSHSGQSAKQFMRTDNMHLPVLNHA